VKCFIVDHLLGCNTLPVIVGILRYHTLYTCVHCVRITHDKNNKYYYNNHKSYAEKKKNPYQFKVVKTISFYASAYNCLLLLMLYQAHKCQHAYYIHVLFDREMDNGSSHHHHQLYKNG